jgi:hypothetical protein
MLCWLVGLKDGFTGWLAHAMFDRERSASFGRQGVATLYGIQAYRGQERTAHTGYRVYREPSRNWHASVVERRHGRRGRKGARQAC